MTRPSTEMHTPARFLKEKGGSNVAHSYLPAFTTTPSATKKRKALFAATVAFAFFHLIQLHPNKTSPESGIVPVFYNLEFPPQTSEASGGNSVNRIACESRT